MSETYVERAPPLELPFQITLQIQLIIGEIQFEVED